jgi:choline dehydrogenase-like flavoprotein
MARSFDFVVVDGGSGGAVIAARLPEDPTCQVALLESHGPPCAESGQHRFSPTTAYLATT